MKNVLLLILTVTELWWHFELHLMPVDRHFASFAVILLSTFAENEILWAVLFQNLWFEVSARSLERLFQIWSVFMLLDFVSGM